MTQNKSKSAQRESRRDLEGSVNLRFPTNALTGFQSYVFHALHNGPPDEGQFLLKYTLCVFPQVQDISGDP